MKIKSIKTKLSLAVGVCSFVTLAILVIGLSIDGRKHALESAKEYTKESASEYAANIKAQIEVGLDVARTLAQVLSSVKDPESPLEVGRDTVNNMLQTILKENELFASAFCIWEPNSFDQMDSAYAGLEGHDNTGRFIPYWTRSAKGGFILQPVLGYGVDGPTNDYLTLKRTLAEYVSELHSEHIAGEDVTLISLVAPIMHDGHFHGVVGIDMQLDPVQQIVAQANLQSGDMQINVISYTGQILASSGGPQLVGAPMKQIHEDWRQELGYIQKGITVIEEDEDGFAAFTPIHIGNSPRPWSVNINTPYETIVAEANYHMWMTMLLGACLATVSVLIIYLLVSKIIRPLLSLTAIAENISKGNLDCEQILTGDDEIGQVNSSFEQVIKSFREVTAVCEAVAEGDFSRTVEVRSEHDVLGKSINQMSQTLQVVVRQANAIADGDYSTEIVPNTEADKLGVALSTMTVKLRETIEENERENWLKTGLGELNNTIRGKQDVVDLAQNIIAKLADYLNASAGAIYLKEEDDTLRMIGSYAYSKRKHISNNFELGQGLVGQAALEKKSILVTEVPDDYSAIRSGLGEAPPRNILVQPFLYENKLTGVIELGSFDKLSDLQLAFLEKAAESIAIAIDSALSRTRMAELLEETQRQSEQLQNQQEELRATNEELEQQTEKLRKSEEVLKTQQEELEASNSELEEKTVALEEQKQELEKSWNHIKAKSKELELASKYKSEFLSNVSHELRTPLNSMLILARMLADNEQGNLSADQVDSAKVILEGGRELLSLINEILDLCKVEAGKMDVDIEEVDLSELIEDLKKNFEHVASDKGLEFTVGISDEVPPAVRSDQKRVKQVLKNFLSNAFKFTEKGSVTLNIARPVIGADLSTSGLRTDNSIAISVTDTGIGIDKDKQKTVLEAFQQADGTTDRIYGGTGLGLAIANRFADLLGGEMQLESTPGKGSTFTLYLPQVLEASNETKKTKVSTQNNLSVEIDEQHETASKVSEPVQLTMLGAEIVPDDRACIQDGDEVILIIEDDAMFAQILVDISGERDFKCIVAGDGQSGLKFAFEYLPVAVILDIGLPGMDGMKVMDALKEDPRTRHIPVHFISARDQDEVGAEAMSKGAIGYLTKPVSKEMLDEAFSNIQHFVTEGIKKLLIVEDDANTTKSVVKLIGSDDVEIQTAATGKDAYGLLTSQEFDCMVLDLGLPDMSGFDLLNQIKDDQAVVSRPPVIVYSGKELSREEHDELQEYTGSVIVKGAESPARLLDETSLFLHRVETSLPAEQQRMIRTLHEKDSVLNDKKVLIVDDDMRNIFALSHALKSKGMVVLRAENGSEAMTILGENPDVDIVLMDIMMPVMDGFETMRKIREQERFWKLPILALTAKAMKGDKEKCIEAGANDYLAKPVDIEKVLSMLRVWLYL